MVTLDVSQPDKPVALLLTATPATSSPKAVAPANMLDMSVTLLVSQSEISPLNTLAPANMPLISVTLEVSHPDKSGFKSEPANSLDISVMPEVSAFSIAVISPDSIILSSCWRRLSLLSPPQPVNTCAKSIPSAAIFPRFTISSL